MGFTFCAKIHPALQQRLNFFRETQQKFAQKHKFTGDQADIGEPAIKTPKKKPYLQELTIQEKSQSGKAGC